MIKIVGTQKEINEFTMSFLDCPPNVPDAVCYSLMNRQECTKCILKHETRFAFEVTDNADQQNTPTVGE